MYSLVIAEDELTTRRGLVNMVKWNQLGFRVDGEFSDGQELLDYLKNNMPDVILTDIKMSRVSGVDIARFGAEQNLPVQIGQAHPVLICQNQCSHTASRQRLSHIASHASDSENCYPGFFKNFHCLASQKKLCS